MAQYDLLIKGGTAVIPRQGEVSCDIGIRGGKFAALVDDINSSQASKTIDAKGRFVFPGAVDGHYHFGINRSLREDVASESEAGAATGATTIVSYFRTGRNYLNKTGPYRTIYPEVLELSEGASLVDYSFHIGIITKEQLVGISHFNSQ